MKNIIKKNVLIIGLGLLLNSLIGCNQHYENNFNELASINKNDDLSVNPLLKKVITVTINPRDSTMSTLYGNDIAWNYASLHSDFNYPKGSKLYEVTWRQKPDSVWFGANIPKKIIMVECVIFTDSESPTYVHYKGHPLKRIISANSNYEERIKDIVSQRMAIAP